MAAYQGRGGKAWKGETRQREKYSGAVQYLWMMIRGASKLAGNPLGQNLAGAEGLGDPTARPDAIH